MLGNLFWKGLIYRTDVLCDEELESFLHLSIYVAVLFVPS